MDSSMTFWWPRLAANRPKGVGLPRTWGIEATQERLFRDPDYMSDVAEAILAIRNPKVPMFMRTDYASDKHGWENSCYLPVDPDFNKNSVVHRLVNFLELHDPPFGPPPFSMIYLREFLELKVAFVAFHGKMPISREFRVFANSEKRTHFQPYWPAGSIASTPWKPLGWPDDLLENNRITAEDKYQLTAWAVEAAAAVNGPNDKQTEWSVDLCQDEAGAWWITDMALGSESYRYDPVKGLDFPGDA